MGTLSSSSTIHALVKHIINIIESDMETQLLCLELALDTLRKLIQLSFDPNGKDIQGNTPLYTLVSNIEPLSEYGFCHFIQLFIECGSHIDAVNQNGVSTITSLQQYIQKADDAEKGFLQGLLESLMPLPLKCLSAQVMARYKDNTYLKLNLPTPLLEFVHIHRS